MSLTDKMGELRRAKGWMTVCTKDDEGEEQFHVVIYLGPPTHHTITTKHHKNVNKAHDEAIDLFKDHLRQCPCC